MLSQQCLYNDTFKLSSTNDIQSRNNDILKIPIVIHLVLPEHKQKLVSEHDIINQLRILNRDFRKKNTNWNFLENRYKSLVADTKIEFYIACTDSDGLAAESIIRTNTSIENIGIQSALFHEELGGSDAWLTDQYLNIWVCEMPVNILGFASSPNDAGTPQDGVVINYRYFGTKNSTTPYNGGRTTVHEIGHYLGLNHPWGNIQDECDEDDGISDTPAQKGPHDECPTHNSNMCSANEQFYGNFMDYSPDCCLSMFTLQQAASMRACLLNTRSGLLANVTNCSSSDPLPLEVNIYPNPARYLCNISWHEKDIEMIDLYDASGQLLRSIVPDLASNHVDICLSSFPKGLLILRITNNKGIVHSRQLIHL